MRLVFAGTPAVALPSLHALLASDHEVVGVVTRPDAAQRRSKTPTPSPVAGRALELGLPLLRPSHPRDADFQAALRELAPDVVPVVAYGALLPPSAIEIPTHGWVNLHFSLLPAWRGAAPVQRALMAGARVTGATTFLIDPGLDSGPVFKQLAVPVEPDETAGDVLKRLSDDGASLLVDTVDAIATGAVPDAQPIEGVSLAPKVLAEDAHIDWSVSAVRVHNQIRGCSQQPGAWTTYRDARFKILRSRLGVLDASLLNTTQSARPHTQACGRSPQSGVSDPSVQTKLGDLDPGQLLVTRTSVIVGTGAGILELGEVQPVGKRPMAAIDWARGLRDEEPWLR